jgi:hypothetical protein
MAVLVDANVLLDIVEQREFSSPFIDRIRRCRRWINKNQSYASHSFGRRLDVSLCVNG